MNNKKSRLKCVHAKENKYGDIICKIRFTDGEADNCDYGKGICKDYEEIK
jgi:hypothetical protein